jgi:hypothetical protein
VRLLVLFAVAVSAAHAASGPEIVAEAQARNATWHDRKSTVRLESFADGVTQTREAEVAERTDPRGEHRTFFEYTAPDALRGTRYLHVSPRGTRDQWWTWMPTTRRVRKLGGTAGGLQRDETFFGRTLSYEDLGLLVRIQQWTDADAAITLDGEEPCGDSTCDRIVFRPVAGNEEFPCKRYRVWYTRGARLLHHAELYDPDDRLMKTITCEGWFASGRFTTARSCRIEHVNGARVTITFTAVAYDSGLPEDLFGLAHLSEGR